MLALNAGTNQGVQLGDEVSVVDVHQIDDPDTHLRLGTVAITRLKLKVNHVQERLCTAVVTSRQATAFPTPTTVRKFIRIVQPPYNEELGVSVALKVGDPVRIDAPPKDEEPPF